MDIQMDGGGLAGCLLTGSLSKPAEKPAKTSSQPAAVRAEFTGISGQVFDPNGAVIPGAVIKITGENGKAIESKTNDIGEYKIALLSGTYVVEISSSGFETKTFSKYIVPAGAEMKLDTVLAVGITCEPEITVPAKP